MTVRELIAALQPFEPDWPCYVRIIPPDGRTHVCEVESVGHNIFKDAILTIREGDTRAGH